MIENLVEVFYNTHPELHKEIQTQIRKGVKGETQNIYSNIDVLLSRIPNVRMLMNNTQIEFYKQNRELFKLGRFEKYFEHLTDETLAMHYCFDNYVFVGVDKEKADMPASLYTNSYRVLKQLEKMQLICGDTVDTVWVKLAMKRKTMLKEAKFCVIRLDLANYTMEGDFQFKLSVPNYMEVNTGGRFFMTPIAAFYDFSHLLRNNKRPLRLTEFDLVANLNKLKVLTLSPDTLRTVLPASVAEKRLLNNDFIGFNPIKLTVDAWDLEAPKSSSGIVNIRTELLSKIEAIKPQQVDTSLADVDLSNVRYYFRHRISKVGGNLLSQIQGMGNTLTTELLENKNYYTLRKGIEHAERTLSSKELYSVMLINPTIFGSKEVIEQTMEKMYNFLHVEPQVIDLPLTVAERVRTINRLANQGVIEFVYQNKQGKLSNRRYTKSRRVLNIMLGDYYVQEYESDSMKLKALAEQLEQYPPEHFLDVQNQLIQYGLDGLFSDDIHSLPLSTQVDIILDKVGNVPDKEVEMLQNPTFVTLRNINARNRHSFILTLNTENIISEIKFYPYNG